MIATGLDLILLLAGAFVAAVVSGVCGFGGGVLFLPLIIALVGPRAAVPLITIGLLFSNFTRLALLRRHIDWPLALRYAAGAIPGAVIGAIVFATLPDGFVTRSIGGFLIVAVLFRRYKGLQIPVHRRWIFIPVGTGVGFFSAIWGAIGPMAVPFFLAAKLSKEAFVATIAIGAFLMHIAKIITYGRLDLLNTPLVKTGLLLGLLMIFGTWVGKVILTRTTPRVFLIVVDILMVVLGVFFLVR
jgi:uncharacterized membrane protein YfcA